MDCINNTTPIAAELHALRVGLQIASHLGITYINIEIDSVHAITILTNGHLLLNNLVDDCRSLLEMVEAAPPVHVYREGNKVADLLAKEGGRRHSQ
ncbi:hypothetical protein P3L10_018696 [Capsicum annuum]